MNIAYNMFSLRNNEQRNFLVNRASIVFKDIDILDTPTIKISNYDDLKRFSVNNPLFKFNPNGYNLDGVQGWKFGELGVWATNWTAWNNFLNSEYEYLILMEDDLYCEEDLLNTIKQYIAECPNDFHALYIYVPEDQYYKYGGIQDVSKNITISYQDWSSACYVIQKNTISKMINIANEGFSLPIDWFNMRQHHLFKSYSVKPDSYKACKVIEIPSTFQLDHDRQTI